MNCAQALSYDLFWSYTFLFLILIQRATAPHG